MYAAALTLSAATTAATAGVPYFQLGSIGPIQSFGIIVAAGVLIGAALLRRYAEWHGVSDDHIRGLTGWITVTGFLGAHIFDVLAYQWHDFQRDPILLFKIWAGISSYGGFLGGAIGFAIYVWWKRLPVRLMADIAVIGLLPAFSIGRIGCTVVSDHIGAAVANPDAWYAQIAMDYPHDAMHANSGILHLFQTNPNAGDIIRAWNLGLVELLYLVPVNALVLWLAFRAARQVPGEAEAGKAGKAAQDRWVARVPSGLVTAIAGVTYAPVRFFLDYLRPENSDPRHLGFTFAQWASIAAFGAAAYLAVRLVQSAKPGETITRTSGEAQEKLKNLHKEDDDEDAQAKGKAKKDKRDRVELPRATAKRLPTDAGETKAKEGADAKAEAEADAALEAEALAAASEPEPAVDSDKAAADEAPAAEVKAAAGPAARPAGQNKSGGQNKGGGKNKNRKK